MSISQVRKMSISQVRKKIKLAGKALGLKKGDIWKVQKSISGREIEMNSHDVDCTRSLIVAGFKPACYDKWVKSKLEGMSG